MGKRQFVRRDFLKGAAAALGAAALPISIVGPVLPPPVPPVPLPGPVLYRLSLSTAWDLSTACYDPQLPDLSPADDPVVPLCVSAEATGAAGRALVFNREGTRLYIVGDPAAEGAGSSQA